MKQNTKKALQGLGSFSTRLDEACKEALSPFVIVLEDSQKELEDLFIKGMSDEEAQTKQGELAKLFSQGGKLENLKSEMDYALGRAKVNKAGKIKSET